MKLTLAYLTNRLDCRIQWFFDSLRLQMRPEDDIRVVVVDSYRQSRVGQSFDIPVKECVWVSPKPNVWNGESRLTKDDWFAAASSRNTALCLAPDGYLVFVDDLSVLTPGWLSAVREHMAAKRVVCGAYKKVKELTVFNGEIKSYSEFPSGIDNRLRYVSQDVTPCQGNWLYGCSCGAPVEVWLSVNGWPEVCDGAGFEDCVMGLVLQNAGHSLVYDRRMLTLESEELHFIEKPFRKEDWHFENGKPVKGGNGADDKSHALLKLAQQSKYFPNYFGEGGIRAVRDQVLAGAPFPIVRIPDREWYTGLRLDEL